MTDMTPRLQRLNSEPLRRLVAVELLAQSDRIGLSDELRALLKCCIEPSTGTPTNAAAARALQSLSVMVDMQPLLTMANHIEDQSWQQAALRYFVMRQAHYPLLRHLFGVSRSEITRLREDIGAARPPLKAQSIPLVELEQIWREWLQIRAQVEREIDQWIEIGQRFPHFPICALYVALVVEADSTTRPGV